MIQKLQKWTFLVLLAAFGVGCSNDDEGTLIEDPNSMEQHFLVDEIYNNEDQLLATYFYNENNQLIKRTVYDPVNYPHIITAENILTYEYGKVNKISVINYTHPQFSHEIQIFYDEFGRIIADETQQFGKKIGRRDYTYFPNGQLKSFITEGGIENYFVNYKNTENPVEVKVLSVDDDSIVINAPVKYRENYRNFIFDDKLKPDFGLGKVFQLEPMPQFGDEAIFEKNISKNNLIEFVGGTKWVHTYNENKLPVTIEVQWKDIEITKPIIFKIKYKVRVDSKI